jgi:hypothetical protein
MEQTVWPRCGIHCGSLASHDDFAEGSKVFDAISKGWPLVLSSLKSYLEANRVLYAPWYDKEPAAAS